MRMSGLSVIFGVLIILLKISLLAEDWPMWGGKPGRNMISNATKIIDNWDVKKGKNIRWVAEIGSQSYGNPTISGGKVFVGTNNQLLRNPKESGDRGVIMAFNESDGKFLWQMTHTKLKSGRVNDWPEQGICSSPAVVGNRLYYVSNRAEIVALDTEGFKDNENDGPFVNEAAVTKESGDVIWKYDMMDEMGVFPHNLATSSPLVVGDLLFVNTSNGTDESHINIPVPRAPSFLAVNRLNGKLAWESSDHGNMVLHGQWTSQSFAKINGREQVIFAGGDGWLYSFDPPSGDLLWKFDCNPKGSEWKNGRGDRNNLIGTPVVYGNNVYIAVGQDPEHGEGIGHLWAVDGTKSGDITDKAVVWHHDFRRSVSTVAIHQNILYAVNFSGFFHALDLKTGRLLWEHDLLAAVWGSPFVVDGKVFIGDEDGDLVILKAGSNKHLIFETNFGNTLYSTPVVANGILYIMTRSHLYAIGSK